VNQSVEFPRRAKILAVSSQVRWAVELYVALVVRQWIPSRLPRLLHRGGMATQADVLQLPRRELPAGGGAVRGWNRAARV